MSDQPGEATSVDAPQWEPDVAYLLSAAGSASSLRWQERLRRIGLDAREVLVLRMVAAQPGRTQRSLTTALRVRASHLVAVVDRLETRGLVQRRDHPTDRRANALHLTRKGTGTLQSALRIAAEHDAEMTASLTDRQRASLKKALTILVATLDVPEGGHPGFDSDTDS